MTMSNTIYIYIHTKNICVFVCVAEMPTVLDAIQIVAA